MINVLALTIGKIHRKIVGWIEFISYIAGGIRNIYKEKSGSTYLSEGILCSVECTNCPVSFKIGHKDIIKALTQDSETIKENQRLEKDYNKEGKPLEWRDYLYTQYIVCPACSDKIFLRR